MARPIFVTDEMARLVCSDVRNKIISARCYNPIEIGDPFKPDARTATLYFAPIAWIKMTALVARFETEVQWHGLVRRVSANEFEVIDIVVPPHESSSTTVSSDCRQYADWLDELDEETFRSLKFHGHSHVNMYVSPSYTDTKYRHDLVTQLPKPGENDDVFYIFFIINKFHEWSAEIYDLTNNALYDTTQIDVQCPLGDCDLDSFIAGAKRVVVVRDRGWNDTTGHPDASSLDFEDDDDEPIY